jgi:hypothetical protein
MIPAAQGKLYPFGGKSFLGQSFHGQIFLRAIDIFE